MLSQGKVAPTGMVKLAAPLDTINLHVRGGSILPGQTEALNTDARLILLLLSLFRTNNNLIYVVARITSVY